VGRATTADRVRRFVVAAAALLAAASGVSAAATNSERTVELTIYHSRFSPGEVQASPGEKLRFVVHNTDPINHELIVGPLAVQLRHESGRERFHPPVPGEVSVPLFSTASTTYVVPDEPVLFGCHLPGHWAYGMQGRISVR
jgi:uncharacterized cupredoxin-like copper-binding protein